MRELNSRKSPTARKILFSEDSRFETATEGIEGGIDVVREDVICVHEGSSHKSARNDLFMWRSTLNRTPHGGAGVRYEIWGISS